MSSPSSPGETCAKVDVRPQRVQRNRLEAAQDDEEDEAAAAEAEAEATAGDPRGDTLRCALLVCALSPTLGSNSKFAMCAAPVDAAAVAARSFADAEGVSAGLSPVFVVVTHGTTELYLKPQSSQVRARVRVLGEEAAAAGSLLARLLNPLSDAAGKGKGKGNDRSDAAPSSCVLPSPCCSECERRRSIASGTDDAGTAVDSFRELERRSVRDCCRLCLAQP